jgi:methylmalonyl-CoA mutase N-terminal domain/subunit
VLEYLSKIEKQGGAINAVENGYIQKEIQDAAYEFHQDIEAGRRIVVGVNKFIDKQGEKIHILRIDPSLEENQRAALQSLRAERDNGEVAKALQNLERASNSEDNLIPLICAAVEHYATVGEISNTLRKSFGKFRPISTL